MLISENQPTAAHSNGSAAAKELLHELVATVVITSESPEVKFIIFVVVLVFVSKNVSNKFFNYLSASAAMKCCMS